MTGRWQISIDTGGSFTDCIATDPDGLLHTCKVLSSSALRATITRKLSSRVLTIEPGRRLPEAFFKGFLMTRLGDSESVLVHDSTDEGRRLTLAEPMPPRWHDKDAVELRSPEEAPLLATRLVTGTPAHLRLPPLDVRLATTRGTNALLTRTGEPVVLFTTEGFSDLLEIGTQQRPHLFAREIVKPEPLVARVIEVPERVDALGRVLRPLDLEATATAIQAARDDGFTCAAVSLLHSPSHPEHEQRLARVLRDAGFRHVSISSELAARTGALARTQTCAVDATLSPIIRDYVDALHAGLGREQNRLHLMTSAGGVVHAAEFRAKDSLLSGPAGGVVGAAAWGRAAGEPEIISFDMGGTSTDVSRYGGDFTYDFEHSVGDVALLSPALSIHTVAAGGGSICDVVRERLTVGPHSAGAVPGPACYGMGGPLTVSDVNLLLGRLSPERFSIPISVEAARRALAAVRRNLIEGEGLSDEQLLEGFLRIANERMADAIRQVSLRRGYDPANHTLVAFGGAGGQHCCAVASMLGVRRVLVPPRASLLSASGLAHAVVERFAERQVLRDLAESTDEVEQILEQLEVEARRQVQAEGFDASAVKTARRLAELRFRGQDSTLTIDVYGARALPHSFRRAYRELFGHVPRQRTMELVSLRVIARGPAARLPEPERRRAASASNATQGAYIDGEWQAVQVLTRDALEDAVPGPVLIEDEATVMVVPRGWVASSHISGSLVLEHEATDAEVERPWAVQRELFAHRLEGMAKEMGELLRRTALSTNVKERLDFSCAVLDADAHLVVNAPHIPVHLGAMGICVREILRTVELAPGDVVVTNHPAYGGSHLPDVTVVMPVDLQDTRLGFVAARAHHAELGGITPGSMPASATNLEEEGVVIPPTFLVRHGNTDWEAIESRLREARYPSRDVDANLADLRAMVAACLRGRDALTALGTERGAQMIARAMGDLRELAHEHLRDLLASWPSGRREASQSLDDGSVLRVAIEVNDGRASFDFTGTSPRHPGNLNATPAIVHSAILYVVRVLLPEEIPLNEGLLGSIDVKLPTCLLHPGFEADPARCPAVVGGNVETSQRLVDTLLQAFGILACGQGTMNNVTFGNDAFGYYETIGGGAGAGPGFAGAHTVHTHMTNTRITDVEVLEQRFPVRVVRFARRRGSGGAGKWPGGDGTVRELEFLEPVRLSLLSQHRASGPYGMEGGADGQPGTQSVVRVSGVEELFPGQGEAALAAGDRFLIQTPGGGGWGAEPTT